MDKSFKEHLDTTINYSLWGFNLILFSVGIYVVTFNIEKFQDCNHVLTIIILGIVNNAGIFMGCTNYLQILNFCLNTPLFIYNVSRNLDVNCETYIINHHSMMWYYFLIQVYFQMFAFISHMFKFLLYIIWDIKLIRDNDAEKQQLINNK